MYSQVQGITRNLMYAASSGLSSAQTSSHHGPHKTILVIDDQQIDWLVNSSNPYALIKHQHLLNPIFPIQFRHSQL
ncbi:unnamed protein product [Anisakis simplex]|uniref:Response regulator n=1 Tax=Anisakis simplex TaxID=6269 RepID=A0A0M3JIR6_ANISI|nr:unnamed protein product [Anisakis simplex]